MDGRSGRTDARRGPVAWTLELTTRRACAGNVVLPACSAWWERASEGVGTFVRNAMKKAGGSTRNGRDSNPKYLGIKKSAGSWIAPGNIIVRQRGTKFHPGEHVLMGKDHTLMALESGKVRFDRDKITKRVFISVDVHAQRKAKKNLIPIAN